MNENYVERVRAHLTDSELLCQLAEECAELAQAALKLRRVITGDNPTPVSEREASADFVEEVADVMGCLMALEFPTGCGEIRDIQESKFRRWAERLEARRAELGG